MSEKVSQRTERDELIYGGVCPVCGEEFTDGWTAIKDMEGESIENVRVCVVEFPDSVLHHFPEAER